MGGKYNASTVGSVVVTITGEADNKIDFITGRNGNGDKFTGSTELVVDTGDILTVNRLDCVIKLTIVEGSTLDIGNLNMEGKNGTVELAINFNIGEELNTEDWTVLSGITLDQIGAFYLNGELTAYENGVLGDYQLVEAQEDDKTVIKFLASDNL